MASPASNTSFDAAPPATLNALVSRGAGAPLADGFTAVRLRPRDTGRLLVLLQPLLADGGASGGGASGGGASGGGAVYCIDGGNVFDPRLLALMAAQFGTEAALGRLFLSRAYTCHQLAAALATLPLPHDRGAAAGVCLLALGLDHLFVDDDLPLWERRHLYTRCLDALAARRAAGVPVLATYEGAPAAEWTRRLRQRAGRHAALAADPDDLLLLALEEPLALK